MFDELYPAERAASLSQSVQRPYRPPEAPGAFRGFGSAMADMLPYAANTSASAWSEILDAYGKAAAYRDAPTVALVHGEAPPNPAELEAETIGKMGGSEIAKGFRERARDFAPDPASVGLAGQIVHGVGATLAKAGVYTLTGPAAPIVFGADVGINRAQELGDQGVDAGTAATAGVISGVAGAVGMRLPAAMGATRLQSAGIGAVVNPALNVVEIGGIQQLLQHADYEKIAAQYRPFDPVNLTVAAITGGVFGAAFHGGKAVPRLTPDEHAAALLMNEVRVRDSDTLTRHGDIASASGARDALALARAQLDAGEPVSVASRLEVEQSRLDAAYQRVLDSPAGEAFAPLVTDVSPEHSGLMSESRAGDTTAGVLHQQDRDTSVDPNLTPHDGILQKVREVLSDLLGRKEEPAAAPRQRAATPEQASALDIATRNPDAVVRLEDGNEVRMAELVKHADDIEAQAKADSKAFEAAIICAVRYPQ